MFSRREGLNIIPTIGLLAVEFSMPTMAQDEQGFLIEEIVVTAQKREQSLNDVGIAVTAFGAEQIKALGLRESIDVAAQTPNVTIKNTFGNSMPAVTVRGIGLNDFQPNNNPAAGVYIDEAFMTSTAMMAFQMFDMARIEVLKGPQGTLYGRNTTAGAINFVTYKPTQEFEAFTNVSAGNYDTYELETAVGGGLSETVSGRFAFKTVQRKTGHQESSITGQDQGEIESYNWRAAIKWDTSEAFDLSVNIHGGIDNSQGWFYKTVGILDAATLTAPCAAFLAGDARNDPSCATLWGFQDLDDDPYTVPTDVVPKMDNESLGAGLTFNWDLGEVVLTSVTGVEKFSRNQNEDADSSPLLVSHNEFTNDIDQYSEELRLTSDTDSDINWILGLFYSYDLVDTLDVGSLQDLLGGGIREEYEQTTESAASFLHTEWSMSDFWKLTAGIRYTWETMEFDGGSTIDAAAATAVGIPTAVPLIVQPADKDFSNNNISGKLGLDYIPNDNWLFYGSLSQGFKSGGYTGSVSVIQEEKTAYDEESLLAYELGFKATLAGSTLQLNGAVFYYDYKDMQAFAVKSGIPTSILTNLPEVTVTGAELELWWRPLSGLDVRSGLSLLDSEIDKSTDGSPGLEGNELANAPEVTFNGMLRYEWKLTDGLMMALSTDFNYVDEVFKEIANHKGLSEEDHWLYNARATLAAEDDEWELVLWGKNLGDEEYAQEIFDQLAFGYGLYVYGMPRTYGLTLNYNW